MKRYLDEIIIDGVVYQYQVKGRSGFSEVNPFTIFYKNGKTVFMVDIDIQSVTYDKAAVKQRIDWAMEEFEKKEKRRAEIRRGEII